MDNDAISSQLLEAARHAHTSHLTQFKTFDEARIADARIAVQALLLINGGSATAILTFAGSLATKMTTGTIPKLFAWSLGAFAFGVACAGTAAMLIYFTNHVAAETLSEYDLNYIAPFVHPRADVSKKNRYATIFHYAGITTAVLAMIAFVAGAGTAAFGLAHVHIN